MTETDRRERDREAAGWLAQEAGRLGGSARVAASTIAALFEADGFDTAVAARITDALDTQGLDAAPGLSASTRPQDIIEISVRGRARVRDEHEQPQTQAAPAVSATPVPAELLASQAAALPAVALGAGALVPGVLLAAAGFAAWWAFGLLFAVLAAGVWLLAGRFRFSLARVFWWPTRSLWLTGFLLVALPLLAVSAVAGAAIVAPVASKRAADDRRDDARARVASGERALRDGDLDGARRDLDAARGKDRSVAERSGLQDRVDAEQERRDADQARRAEERADAEQYASAVAALRDGDPGESLRLLGGLDDDYKDVRAQTRRATAALAARQLRSARRALGRGDYRAARRLARDSYNTRATRAARAVETSADRAISRQRALAQQRARERAAARAFARAERRRRAAERRAAEEAAAAAPVPSAPDTSGPSTYNWCGKRDGDNDGIYCE